METAPMPHFVMFRGENGLETLLNINQVRSMGVIAKDRCRVIFAPEHILEVGGQGAEQVLVHCMAHSTLANGTSVASLMEKWVSKHDPTSQSP